LNKAYRFPPHIAKKIREEVYGIVVNMCSGDSDLGLARIDLHNRKANIRADCCHLPIKARVADCVILDPPWHLDPRKKRDMFFEAIRIMKLGGRIFITDPYWYPSNPLLKVDYRLVYSGRPHLASILHKLTKVHEHLFW